VSTILFGDSYRINGTPAAPISASRFFRAPVREGRNPSKRNLSRGIPETLLSSELFGHKRGAFTGAFSDKKGLFELADGGTVFLDEIADLSPQIQVKLLRAVQDKMFKPVGGSEDISVDIRIISATNKKLEDVIKTFYFYKKYYNPDSQLLLAGDYRGMERYLYALQELVYDLDIKDVTFTGSVEFAELLSYFRLADVYLSMSEHEGFCMPLIESMLMEVPILAYAATAVPGTLEHTGIQFHQKDYPALAQLVDLIMADQDLRQRVVARQRDRVQAFLAPQVQQTFAHHLRQVGLLGA